MKKIIILFYVVMFIQPIMGQVRIEYSAIQKEERNKMSIFEKKSTELIPSPYDSTEFIIESQNLEKYIGQYIFVLPYDYQIKEEGKYPVYYGFFTSCEYKSIGGVYKKQIPLPVYKPVTKLNIFLKDRIGSDYESLRGKKFEILGFTTSQDVYYRIHRFAILHDGKDSVYFEYDEHPSSYIIEGYIVKKQKDFKNHKFARKLFLGNDTCKDFVTGKGIKLIPGEIWTCCDIIIEPDFGHLAYIMKNANGQTISSTSLNDDFMPKFESDKLKNKYGQYCWKEILKGNVYVGMPASAAKIAWGVPRNINKSSHGEQWCYNNQYIYVRNGRVTGFN